MATILDTTITQSGTFNLASGNKKAAAEWIAAIFQLEVVNADTDAGDTLDIAIQHSVDEGQNWTDFINFTQILGTASPGIEQKTWTLAIDGAVGHDWRVNWTVVDSGTDNASFTVKLLVDLVVKGRVEPAFLVSYDNVASGLTAGSVQAAIDEVVTITDTLDAATDAHLIDTTAHDASAIVVTPTGGITEVEVQAALEELDARVTALEP